MKFDLAKKHEADIALQRLKELIDKCSLIELVEKKPPRNIDQLRLYWVWLTIISHEAGITKEELHYMYRGMLLQRDPGYITKIIYHDLWTRIKDKLDGFVNVDNIQLVIDIISKSTKELDTGEMANYMGDVKNHALLNYSLKLKSINEPGWDDFCNYYRKYF